MTRTSIAVCSALLLLTAAAAFAEPKDKGNDAGPVNAARISLDAAVVIAEKHANGKAVRAEYEKRKDGSWVYDVEVRAGNAVTDVSVDADKGTVLASKADPVDSDDDDDKAD